MSSQEHYFTSRIKKTRFYSLLLSGYIKSTGVFSNLRVRKITLSGIFSFLLSFARTVNFRKIRLILNNNLVKFIMPIIKTVVFPKPRIVSVFKLTTKYYLTILFKKINLSAVATLIRNFTSSLIKFPRIKLTGIPEIATYYKLLTYDPQQLNAMDSKTLAQLDKVVS